MGIDNKMNLLFLENNKSTDVGVFKVISSIMDSGGINDTPDGAVIYTYVIKVDEWEERLVKNKYGFVFDYFGILYFSDIINYDKQKEILLIKGREDGTEIKTIDIKKIKSINEVKERCF